MDFLTKGWQVVTADKSYFFATESETLEFVAKLETYGVLYRIFLSDQKTPAK